MEKIDFFMILSLLFVGNLSSIGLKLYVLGLMNVLWLCWKVYWIVLLIRLKLID